MSSLDVATKYVDRINAHDVQGMIDLMTPDHVFVDSLGARSARPGIEDGWRQYLSMVPDYAIRIDRTMSDGETVVLIGEAGGTYVPAGGRAMAKNRWSTPSVWVAKSRGRRISEWRIFADNEPIRAKMRRAGPTRA